MKPRYISGLTAAEALPVLRATLSPGTLISVQAKRHPYDLWHDVPWTTLPDADAHARYRLVLYWHNATKAGSSKKEEND